MTSPPTPDSGWIAGIVRRFIGSQLAIISIVVAACLGVASILITPREEEPQIVVPLADVFVQAPGATPEEVEQLVATPLERLLFQIDGVEYVYSMSKPGLAVVTVRFLVGEDRENSLIKLHNRITMHMDQAPAIVRGWVVKPVEIDDVPIVTLTLHSQHHDDHQLRRMGEEMLARLGTVTDISRTEIVGGRRREIRVALQPERMAGLGISLPMVHQALAGADAAAVAGTFDRANQTITVSANAFLTSAAAAAEVVVGSRQGRPVYVRDVAQVLDGPEEATVYSRIGFSEAYRRRAPGTASLQQLPAVTLALSKKKGTNAVAVAEAILAQVDHLAADLLPEGVDVTVSRNYGQTAKAKVNELLSSLAFAIGAVVILLSLTLGWREAAVVALAVPISFSLALFVNLIFGYTINRVTLFALILSLGLVVDDPITNVDNIQRHIRTGKRPPDEATVFAVGEVLPPVIMSTLAIIVSFTPLFFITGMMGPYMAPMAINVPLTVIFSTLCALTVVPWLTHLLLRRKKSSRPDIDRAPVAPWIQTGYRKVVAPFLASRGRRWMLLATVVVLLVFSMGLGAFRMVPLKLLPFDNKNEFQLVIDMPEGTPLEATDAVVRRFEAFLNTVPEVTHYVSYTGAASPMDFNGLVRHYYLRRAGNLADIRVNLLPKEDREQQSHAIALRLRDPLTAIARDTGAVIKIVETPPGPPVLSTVVAEMYGRIDQPYADLIAGAAHVRTIMGEERFVVDIDDSTETSREKIEFILDKEKAALHGIATSEVVHTLETALSGATAALVHLPNERHPLKVRVILPRPLRSGAVLLLQIPVRSPSGAMIPLEELVHTETRPEPQPIYHKNLERVVFVTAEMAGQSPAEAVLDIQSRLKNAPPPDGIRTQWAGEGEWKITIRVFRDMGIAFAAAMLGIYILLVIDTGSFSMPMLIMMAIPLTLLGIMPGFWLLNLVAAESVGAYNNPIFFTATSMIGMIALGGIVIRNSLVLIEFIQDAVRAGTPFKEAIIQSGAIRMRPILLTAATTAIGAFPITFDPVFSGLAWALIFGLVASTGFTLLVVPVTYFALYAKRHG